jgi:hypothetical protein
MERRSFWWVLFVISAALLLLSLTADLTGLGRSPGFGLWQWGGTILGIVLMGLGGFLRRRSLSFA